MRLMMSQSAPPRLAPHPYTIAQPHNTIYRSALFSFALQGNKFIFLPLNWVAAKIKIKFRPPKFRFYLDWI
jgi:hypothetical protein